MRRTELIKPTKLRALLKSHGKRVSRRFLEIFPVQRWFVLPEVKRRRRKMR